MALKALETAHSLAASSPTLESRPLITVIPGRILIGCKSLFSLDMPKKVTEILILSGDSREFKDD
jgi:hypothetical protein